MRHVDKFLKFCESALKNHTYKDDTCTRMEIIKKIEELIGEKLNKDSLLPSDYCYNRINKDTKYPLFELLDNNAGYKILGPNFPYEGKIFHHTKSGEVKEVGHWIKGKCEFYDKKNLIYKSVMEAINKNCSPQAEEITPNYSFETECIELDYYPETAGTDECIEGAKKTIPVNIYERSADARQKCINFNGCYCHICDINFEEVYGEVGKNFIHIHHKIPLSEIGEEYVIDPINDLLPVCPNCHAMLHRKIDGKCLSIGELKSLYDNKKMNC